MLRLDYNNIGCYYHIAAEKFYNDFFCGIYLDFADQFGFVNVEITNPSAKQFKLQRYYIQGTGQRLYINPNSEILYQNFECSKSWGYDDPYEINMSTNTVIISNSFKTRIELSVDIGDGFGAKTYNITEKSLTMQDAGLNVVTNFVYYVTDINLETRKFFLELGTSGTTLLNDGAKSISANKEAQECSINGVKVKDGLKARTFANKYFGSGETSVITESYVTDMELDAFLIDSLYLYISNGEVFWSEDFNNDKKINNRTITDDDFTGEKKKDSDGNELDPVLLFF